MGQGRVALYSVDSGQPPQEVKLFAARHGLQHFIQPLQRKEDYRRRYTDRVESNAPSGARRCRYLDSGSMRYFNVDGLMMPCCFIKDAQHYRSIDALRAELAAGATPRCCSGCAQLA
jgi:hypothetical protein